MLVALILGLAGCQDPAPPPPGETPVVEAPVVEAPKVVENWDDRRAKDAASELTNAFKGKPSMRERNLALERLATASNKLLVKPLQVIVENDNSIVIRKRAVELLANQPAKDANSVIQKLMKSGRVQSQPSVMAGLVLALSRCGYTSSQWSEIDDLFESQYALDRVTLQEALLALIEQHKEKEALPMLLRNLDEPIPANVHDGSNPPAEYWEARWKSWQVWRGKVKDALFAITGQRFSTSAEAREWLKKNPLR